MEGDRQQGIGHAQIDVAELDQVADVLGRAVVAGGWERSIHAQGC